MIGERLKQERERLGLTLPEFAEAAGAKKNTVIDWQKDVSSPPASKLAALAGIGVDVLYVVTGRREQAASKTEQPVQITDEHRLRLAAEGVFEGLAEIKRKLPPAKLAELIVVAYQLTAGPEQQAKSNVLRLVRAAA